MTARTATKKKAKPKPKRKSKRKQELVPRGREALLARPVVDWLQREGWTTHEEVAVKGPVADIVATRGGVYMVVEVKAAMSFSVLEQAERWRACAHLVFVAVPHAKDRHFQQRIHPHARAARASVREA